MQHSNNQLTWRVAIQQPLFKQRLIIGLIILVGVLCYFPFFFGYIQQRQGIVLHDYLLARIPAVDLSIPLFVCIWGTAVLIFIRVLKSPAIFIKFLWAFIFLSLLRTLTITLVVLNPPENLIDLTDPLANAFYGKSFITKDLFFSGHTATMLIIYFCLEKKSDKLLALASSILVAIFVLIQHVHYTVDIVFAPPFAYVAYYCGVKATALNKLKPGVYTKQGNIG